MKVTSADLLEFDALKRLLRRYVASPLGQTELEKVQPRTSRMELEEELAETSEAMEYVKSASRPQVALRGAAVRVRFDSLPDPAEALRKLRIEGATLDGKEISDLAELLDRAGDIRRLLASTAQRFPKLGTLAERVGEFHLLVRDLAGRVLPDGTLADDASAALGRLRRDIDKQKKSIQESLERFLRTHHEEGLLQEEFITIRNERFVVPVIAGRQRRIEGVIHGASGSGHTLFVEPLETIELNNELVRLTEEELRETHRILREMTARLREHEESIRKTVLVLGELELLFAKARFGADFDCTIPRFSEPPNRRLILREARHPLLEDILCRQKKRIVPLSLTLEGKCRTLLVSGPNTGGKTVTLKTVGLLALAAQSGLPVPCTEAEFPLFSQVLADIGDNQSIQESLSTFSAHIGRLREMLEAADSDSLVLLDELGRATDPEEGGALGAAVIERFRALGAFTLASTHLLALKIYGAGTEGVVNGSMGFNEDTLEPTYVLTLGTPGKSAGLEIARRLDMPEQLIEEARQRLGSRELDIARFLAELHRRLEDVSSLELQLAEQKEALAKREETLAREWSKRETAKLKELERRCDLVLDRFEAQARETIEKIVADADRKKLAGPALRRVAKSKRELREEMETTILSTQDDARQGELGQRRARIEEGVRVRVKGIREPARVRRRLSDDLVEVEAGFMKLQVPADEILEVLPLADSPVARHVSFDAAPLSTGSIREINVIGEHADEACAKVEKFLDNAVLADASRVRIVHGHGMGILRRAIADLLASNPNVEKFYPAEQHEGGAGATIVELKG